MAGTQSVNLVAPPYPETNGYEPCATTDPELFFPERNNNYLKTAESAKRLCQSCPVRLPCRLYAVGTDVEGIWGGTDEKERKEIRTENGIEPYKLMRAYSQFLP